MAAGPPPRPRRRRRPAPATPGWRRPAGRLRCGRSRRGRWCTGNARRVRPGPGTTPGRTGRRPAGPRLCGRPAAAPVPRPTGRNSAATLVMAWGAWRSRIWVAELAMTARPRSVAEDVLGVLGDGGQPGPGLAGGFGQPVQELRALAVAHQQPRLIDGDQPPPAAGRVGHLPPGRVQRQQGRGGAQLVGDVAEAEDDQVPLGAGGGRRGEQPGVAAFGERDEPVGQRGRGRGPGGAQRGGQGGQQRRGPRPGARIGGDPGLVVGGHDRLVQGGALGRGRAGRRAGPR